MEPTSHSSSSLQQTLLPFSKAAVDHIVMVDKAAEMLIHLFSEMYVCSGVIASRSN